MAGTLLELCSGHPGGGSLALGEILDSHGEELFIDLKREFAFDIAEFVRGEVNSSPRLVLTMIRHLPEGANFTAAQAVQLTKLREHTTQTDPDVPLEIDPIEEFKQWTEDRRLMAQLINAVNLLVRHSVQWQKPPNIPLVGPSSWRGEGESKPSKTLTVMDVINNITGTNG